MKFDPAAVPFSRFGSYFAISYLRAHADLAAGLYLRTGAKLSAGLYLRTVHGDALRTEICRIDLLDGDKPVIAEIHATPTHLWLECSAGRVDICYGDAQTLRMQSTGVGLRLTFFPLEYDHALQHPQGWAVNSFSNRIRLAFTALRGELQVHAPMREGHAQQLLVNAPADSEFAVSELPGVWPIGAVAGEFSAALQAVSVEFQRWLELTPVAAARYAGARELAAYVQWSAVGAAQGNFRQPAMLMSKNWLQQVWSWDHCFNAMALSYHNPALAWDQFILPFTHQNAAGALPDCVNDKLIIWNFTKPPIHGWALSWMLRHAQSIDDEQLQAIYQPLGCWTEWWLQYRDDNGNGIAQYNHGNDSGWDNCTLFDDGIPLETPDLSAFLLLQMEALAEIALRLGQTQAASDWAQRAEELLQKMLEYFWRDDGFVAIAANQREVKTQTLFLLLPLVLGKRLPQSIRDVLLAQLQLPEFLTPHGLASESTASDSYRADGYWRGPIWAPAVLLIVSGLADMGELTLAREISQRFCATVEQHGMAENFNALTGVGLRDQAHTLTASVFLILAHGLTRVDSAAR